MKWMVKVNQPCAFKYSPIYGNQPIDTFSLSIKEQLCAEMVLTRYTVSSIYHLGAFGGVSGLMASAKDSYGPKFNGIAAFNNNVQISISYFKEAWYPMARLSKVYPWIEKLLTPASQSKIVQLRREVFEAHQKIVECNLGYLLIQKLRLLHESRKCKEGAKNIVEKLKAAEILLSHHKSEIKDSVFQYIACAKLFFEAITIYHYLRENEERKTEEDYGFVKKEFKQMILENTELAKHMLDLGKRVRDLKQESDYYEFAVMMFDSVLDSYAKQCLYVYSVKTDNSSQMYKNEVLPSVPELWDLIPQHDLTSDL